MTGRELSVDDRDWVATMMESTGAREKTESMARHYCESARAALDGLPATPYKDAMFGITDFVIARES
jgi:geranylgeranyl pyrophosphate synthase